ncbi:MAG: hypothetical protein O3A20_04685 [Planctomycetota bacterium]|nr:hypothetical protein [Planctomycetota bacterium]
MRKGFTLLEFSVFCVLLLTASTLLIPRALQPRRELNEAQAVGYLAMIGAAERAWLERSGAYVSLQRTVQTDPARDPRDAAGLPPLVPPDFLFDGGGIGHRGGFRFRICREPGGRIAGCWAWPNLEGFSGEDSYWASFTEREVRRVRVRYSWKNEPPAEPPTADDLQDAPLAKF